MQFPVKFIKRQAGIAAILTAALVAGGCDGPGGGASLVPAVTVLPPDLSGDAVSEDTGAEETAAAQPTASGGVGSIVGRVVVTGSYSAPGPLYAAGAAPKDPAVCGAEAIPNESVVIGEGNGLQNVFIYMAKAPKGSPKPEIAEQAMIFDQKNCRFLPHCMIIPVGQDVKVLSADAVAHNTHTNPAKNTGVSVAVDPNDRVGNLVLNYPRAENTPFPVTCDFHAWMRAWHLPVDNPWYALTANDGSFEITDVPAGEHKFTVWHEAVDGNYINRNLTVTVTAGAPTELPVIEVAADKLPN